MSGETEALQPLVYEGDDLLKGKTVFLSASKPSRQEELFRVASEVEIEEGVRSLARAVFAEKGRLVFGAHPSISPLIVDVATEYFPPQWVQSEVARPVSIYQSGAFKDVIPPATRALESLGYAEIHWTAQIDGEAHDPAFRDREQCLKSLALMRTRMFQETRPVAMVAAGGMQGVIREARLFLEMFPGNVYVLSSTGGASERLADYLGGNFLKDEKPIAVPNWQRRLIPAEDRFGLDGWKSLHETRAQLPEQPWAVIMQKIVQDIAGGLK